METLTVAILVETIIQCFTGLITVYFSFNILFPQQLFKQTRAISPTIVIFLYYQLIWGVLTISYCFYEILLWRPEAIIYDQKTLYAIGFPSYTLTLLNTVIECFLGLDRCICILFPLKYNGNLKHVFAVLTLSSFAAYSIFLMFMNKSFDLFFQDLNNISCRFFGCIVLQTRVPYIYIFKLFTIVVNALTGIVLFGLLKYYLRGINNKISERIHRTVVFVILSTTFFETLPNLIGFIYLKVSGKHG